MGHSAGGRLRRRGQVRLYREPCRQPATTTSRSKRRGRRDSARPRSRPRRQIFSRRKASRYHTRAGRQPPRYLGLRHQGSDLETGHVRSEERRVGKGVDLGGRRIIKKKKKKNQER